MTTTTYILMQKGRILDTATHPATLLYSAIDTQKNWGVWVGCINEFGKKEVVACVASVRINNTLDVWYITSPLDGYLRMVGRVGTMQELVRERLRILCNNGHFNDLANIHTFDLEGSQD